MKKQKTFYAVEFVRQDGKPFARREFATDDYRGGYSAFGSIQRARNEASAFDGMGIPARVVPLLEVTQ